MASVIHLLNIWSGPWAAWILAAVWQSTLLTAVVVVLAYALRRSSPAARYWLWQVVAIKLLVIPFWSWSIALPWRVEDGVRVRNAEGIATEGTKSTEVLLGDARVRQVRLESARGPAPGSEWGDLGWREWALLGWGAIVGVQMVRLAAQRYRLSRALGHAVPAGAELTSAVGALCHNMRLKRSPAVLLTDMDCSPFVCGVLRPKLVLPDHLVGLLGKAEWNQVLSHELAHVRRHDLFWGWIPEIARVLFFFHPVAHFVAYRIRLERELACDQLAMAQCGRGPAEYAETLLRVISSISRPNVFRTSAAMGLDDGAASEGSGQRDSDLRSESRPIMNQAERKP